MNTYDYYSDDDGRQHKYLLDIPPSVAGRKAGEYIPVKELLGYHLFDFPSASFGETHASWPPGLNVNHPCLRHNLMTPQGLEDYQREIAATWVIQRWWNKWKK